MFTALYQRFAKHNESQMNNSGQAKKLNLEYKNIYRICHGLLFNQ